MKVIFRLFLALLTTIIFYNAKAQAPNISYNTPQTLYVGKATNPITPTNSGGSVPNGYNAHSSIYIQPERHFEPGKFVIIPGGGLYETSGSALHKIGKDGKIALFAGSNFQWGSVDGTGSAARFNEIYGIALDASGNLFLGEGNSFDPANCKIRKVTPQGVVTTFAKDLYGIGPLVFGSDGSLFVVTADGVKKISKTGVVSAFAAIPSITTDPDIIDMVIDKSGNLFLADFANKVIHKVSPTGQINVFAGSTAGDQDGVGTAAKFSGLESMVIDSDNNLWGIDGANSFSIKKISPNGTVTTISRGLTVYDEANNKIVEIYGNSLGIDAADNLLFYGNSAYRKLFTTGYSIEEDLPEGLLLNPDGSITGTPVSIAAASNYKITATNKNGANTATINIQVVAPTDPPVITSFINSTTAAGHEFRINGSFFLNAGAVTIGGKAATEFHTESSTVIWARVPDGATSGQVSVTTPNGTASLGGLVVIQPPVITSLSATSGKAGDKIIITGSNLSTTRTVYVGGYTSEHKVVSDTELEVTLTQWGASGDIALYTFAGDAKYSGFTYIYPPTISSFTPLSAGSGITVTITGTNFYNVTAVKFGATAAASFTVESPTTIKAVVGGGSNGQVSIVTAAGTIFSAGNFVYVSPPTILSVTPLKAGAGSTVYVNGSNLLNAQVTVAGIPATILYGASNQIAIVVPAGVTTGEIKVTTPSGSATSAGFTLVPPPQITSFSPATAGTGDHVIINGQNFTDATQVFMGGALTQFTVVSPTVIDAVVGQAASGIISVRSPGGEVSFPGFIYKGAAVTAFAPVSAGDGETVTLTGSNFAGATKVTFGGVDAKSFTIVSATEIKAVVGTGTSGSVGVTTGFGSGYLAGFSHPGPSINSFTPNYAGPLSTAPIIITGKNFTGATAVSFGGVPAASFVVTSATTISAFTANTTSGDVEITTPAGTIKRTGFTWVQPPVISSFTPTGQKTGSSVTITGNNFIGVTTVTFGGVASQGVFPNSATTLTAFVGNGASGDVKVTTVGGTASLPGFVYTTPSITSIIPAAAGAGQTVTIAGTNLSEVQQVRFGGINATSFTIVSATEIKAVLGDGASGTVTLNGPSSTIYYSGFTYVYPATLYSVEPKQGGTGTEITINGYNLAEATQVTIGGTPVDIITKNQNIIKVKAGNGTSGTIAVKTPVSDLSIEKFEWFAAPVITSISPSATNTKDTVTVNGTNLTGIKSILFGDRFGEYWKVTPTQAKLINISGGTGTITINTTGGSVTFSGYTFIAPPVINSYSVTGEGEDATVVINGSNFYSVTSVAFGGVPAKSFAVDGPNKITAIVGAGANGSVTVTTSGGSVSVDGFLYKNPPLVFGVTPLKGPAGTLVTINGRSFNLQADKNLVYFGSVRAEVISAAKNKLQVKVPEGAGSQIVVIDKDKQLSGYASLSFYLTRSTPSTGFAGKLEIGFDNKDNLAIAPRLALGDFDGDGKTDLVIGAADSINILQNTGSYLSRSAFKKINVSKNRWVYGMTVGDIDSDGKPDIIFSQNQSLVVLRNTTSGGAISFETKIFEGLHTGDAMAIRDFDWDGKPDLLLAQKGIYKNTSIGSDISFGTFVGMGAESVGDINGDGRPDFVHASNPNYSGIVWYYNQAINGRFSAQSFIFSSETFAKYYKFTSSVLSDFNDDGTLDIMTFGNDNSTYFIKHNATGPLLAEPQLISSFYLGSNVNSQDINGDGKPDLLAGKDGAVYAYINNLQADNLQFNSGTEVYKGGKDDVFLNYLVNDIDRDGSPDLLMVDYHKGSIIILHNNADPKPEIANFLPKAAPKNGKVTITGKHFDEAMVVKFGSKAAKSFNIISPEKIEAIIGEGETGKVTVQTPYGTAEYTNFTFLSEPVIKTKAQIILPTAPVATYGDADFAFSASSTNADMPVLYAIDKPDIAAISDGKIHIFKAGVVTVTVSQEGDYLYDAADNVSQTITIAKAPLTLIPDNITRKANEPNPLLVGTAKGFVNNENTNNLIKVPVWTTTATDDSPPGVYDIIGSGGEAENYDFVYQTGKLTVLQLKPLITFPAITARRYGDADVDLGGTSTNHDVAITYTVDNPNVATVVNSKLHILKAGTVKITAGQEGNIIFESAESIQQTVVIEKVPLTITADDKTRIAGKPDPAFTATYQGFVKSETQAMLTQLPVVTTTATAASGAGVYDILATGSLSDNYSFIYNNGKLTITPALDNLRVSATDVTCKGQGNGIIAITAKQTASYTAVLTGNGLNKSYTFTTNLNIENLLPGAYKVCVADAALPGQSQCFDLTIAEPKDLSVYATVKQNTSLLNVLLAGGSQYQVTLNGVMYSTRNSSITLELNRGSNKLEVITDKECQGKVEQIVNYSGNPVPYPNPFSNELYVNVGIDVVNATIKIYSVTDGLLKLSEQFKNVSGVIKLDVSKLKMGVYSVHVVKGDSESVYKVIKQ